MSKLARFTTPLWDLDVSLYTNDFPNFTTAQDGVTSLAADAGSSVAAVDARRGLVRLTSGATDNNETAVKMTQEIFIFAAASAIYGRARIQWTEPATNTANVFAGFGDAIAADFLVDNGGGVRVTGSIFGIYKKDGETLWRAYSRNGANFTETLSNKTAGGSAFQTLEVYALDWDQVSMELAFKVDGEYLRDANNQPIRHSVLIASATEMMYGVYEKTGSANSLVVDVDQIYAHQTR